MIENLTLDFQAASNTNLPSAKTWQERQADQRDSWDNCRAYVFQQYVSRQPFVANTCCNRCKIVLETTAVRCMTCKHHYCWECDDYLHFLQPFHRRFFVTDQALKPLQPCEFHDEDWKKITKGKFSLLWPKPVASVEHLFPISIFLINVFNSRCVRSLLCAQ